MGAFEGIKNSIIHLRLKMLPSSFILALTGYAANPSKPENLAENLGDLFWVFLSYSILIWGGTCAYNSYMERDTDQGAPLNHLEFPPPIPRYLGVFGVACMIAGVAIASCLGTLPFLFALGFVILSLLYSTPLGRWKGKQIGILDNFINALGAGFMSVGLTYTFYQQPFDEKGLLYAIAFTVSHFGSYAGTQIHQLQVTDTYKEGRNFTSILGASRALRIGAICVAGALSILLFADRDEIFMRPLHYGVFSLLFILSSIHTWRWARDPWSRAFVMHQKNVRFLLGARLVWIWAQW